MSEASNKGILQYWPQIGAMISFVFAVGVFYSENKTMKAKQAESEIVNKQRYDELQGRYQRQFELINRTADRLIEVEKKISFREGYEKALIETKK